MIRKVGLRGVSLTTVRTRRVGVGHEAESTAVEQIRLLWDDCSTMLWDDGSTVIAGSKRVVKEPVLLLFDDGSHMCFDDGSHIIAGYKKVK